MSLHKTNGSGEKNMPKRLHVAIIAPPWLALPIKGYGGIELVLQGLVEGLKKRGIDVELFANGAHTMRGIKTHSLYKTEQFEHIYEPYFESFAIVQAHLLFAYNKIVEDGTFDIIHCHVPHVGPSFWALASRNPKLPPILTTFHGPPFLADVQAGFGQVYNSADIEQIQEFNSLYAACISDAMTTTVPKSIAPRTLPAVHNAINPDDFPFEAHKKSYFITLARFAPYKGQHIAVKAAAKLHKRLRMAGVVSDITSNRKLLFELANPLSSYRGDPQFRYYSDKILPFVLRYPYITYSGNLSGRRKMKFLSEAKALLFPIEWDEPFGMSVIEALACGTPVIAMNRGAMPEIIEHGVTGFLANNEEEFIEYMRRIDEIDPEACRRSVEERFSADAMAAAYTDRYEEVIRRHKKSLR
ncbi:MAG: glycosyltransferase family 4 protein [Candidatus Saccharimonas sp.]